MLRLRVTNHTVYPASTNGRNFEPNIPAIGPRGTSEPGPPGIHTSVFDPSPHRAYSIPLAKVPVSAAGTPFIAPRTFATASVASAAVPKPTTAVRFFMTPPIPLSSSQQDPAPNSRSSSSERRRPPGVDVRQGTDGDGVGHPRDSQSQLLKHLSVAGCFASSSDAGPKSELGRRPLCGKDAATGKKMAVGRGDFERMGAGPVKPTAPTTWCP